MSASVTMTMTQAKAAVKALLKLEADATTVEVKTAAKKYISLDGIKLNSSAGWNMFYAALKESVESEDSVESEESADAEEDRLINEQQIDLALKFAAMTRDEINAEAKKMKMKNYSKTKKFDLIRDLFPGIKDEVCKVEEVYKHTCAELLATIQENKYAGDKKATARTRKSDLVSICVRNGYY